MKTLKKKLIKADNKKQDNGFFWEKDVKEAVLKSYKNNEICINQIIGLIEDIELTDEQRFFIMMVLDGIKRKNKGEVFGDFEE